MFRGAWRSLATGGISDQTWMARKEPRRPFTARLPPNQLVYGQQQERFTNYQKERGDHVAGPVRTQIDPGVANSCSDEPVEPAPASIKQRAKNSNDGVGGHVSRRKRRSRPVAIG